MISITSFSDIGKRHLIRFGARYVDFWKNKNGQLFETSKATVRIKDFVFFASGKVIKKNEVDGIYQLVNLANIEAGTGYPINLESNIVVEIGSDKIYLSDADLVFSKLNSHIGYVFLIDEIPNNGYDIIGSTEFYPLVVNSNNINAKLLKYLLLHKSFRQKAVFLRSGKSQSHPRIQKDDFFNLKIPLIDENRQKKLLQKIIKIEKKLDSERKKIETLQLIIDQVLTDYGIKSGSQNTYRTTTLNPAVSNIGQRKALRIGAEYNDFWLTHKGMLFEGISEKIKTVYLKRIIQLAPKIILKKGILHESKVLIDFKQIEARSGRIIDFENIVTELGSDRIEFCKCDFLTNKLRPYLGYTILNQPDLSLIGTPEFIPFNIRDKFEVSVEFVRYLLLSTEYLEKSKFLMSGKEHPRINAIDILNIQVPLPDPDIQKQIVEEISERETKSLKARDKMDKIRQNIDDLISKDLEIKDN